MFVFLPQTVPKPTERQPKKNAAWTRTAAGRTRRTTTEKHWPGKISDIPQIYSADQASCAVSRLLFSTPVAHLDPQQGHRPLGLSESGSRRWRLNGAIHEPGVPLWRKFKGSEARSSVTYWDGKRAAGRTRRPPSYGSSSSSWPLVSSACSSSTIREWAWSATLARTSRSLRP